MLRSRGGRCSICWLSKRISPELGFSNPAISRRRVDLPQPEGPRRMQNSPSPTSKEMSFRISLAPNCFESRCTVRAAIALLPVDGKNPKSQYRNPKQAQIPIGKSESLIVLNFPVFWASEIVSSFEFRASNFVVFVYAWRFFASHSPFEALRLAILSRRPPTSL